MKELEKFFSVEKMLLAQQTKDANPTLFTNITKLFGENVGTEVIDHTELKDPSKTVKAVIRTGYFTAFGNVILVSGAGRKVINA